MSGYQQISNDLKELLKLLLAHRVEFVLIGAHAVAVHGRPRFAELEILVSRRSQNLARLAEAIHSFGVELQPDAQTILAREPRAKILIGADPFQVEILNHADGLEFESVLERSEIHELRGVKVPVLSLPDLVANKRASNRPKDLFDLAMLREIHGVLPGDEAE